MRLVAIGLVAGLFSALFGVGGGIIAVPLIMLALGVAPRVASATSLAAIGVTALAGTIAYAIAGHVDPGYAALVGLPAAAGAFTSATLQQRVSNRALSAVFAALLATLGVWLIAG